MTGSQEDNFYKMLSFTHMEQGIFQFLYLNGKKLKL